MPKQIYIAVGNHRSLVGINEIIYTLCSCFSESFSVALTRSLKPDCVNILIDEFASSADIIAIEKTKELYPNTKIVIVATEFVTPVSLLGVELLKTFNFFGNLRDWYVLLGGTVRSQFGGMPPYMGMRYRGFVRMLKYCDLLAVVHPAILPTVAELVDEAATHLPPPLMVYPRIDSLSTLQQNRFADLPVGFTMTGTQTRYRREILRKLTKAFKRFGWYAAVYKNVPFEVPATTISSANDKKARASSESSAFPDYLRAQYDLASPEFLFNFNPPQTADWPYSSPMRILRAIMLGQIPVVSEKFHDHLIEDIAMLWDGKSETAVQLGTWQLRDRQLWLTDYLRSIEAYDRKAREENKPLVDAMMALVDGMPGNAPRLTTTGPEASAALRQVG